MITQKELKRVLSYNKRTGLFRWKISICNVKKGRIAGTPTSDGYINIRINGRIYRSHRLAWLYVHGRWPNPQIDHKNGKGTDNRWSNLRESTQSQNRANAKKFRRNCSSIFKGVSRHMLCINKWSASFKGQYLGLFNSPELASAAYVRAAKKHFGRFARAA